MGLREVDAMPWLFVVLWLLWRGFSEVRWMGSE